MRIALILLLIGSLTACSAKMPELTKQHGEMQKRDDEVMKACYESLANVEAAKQANIAALPMDQRGMVIMLSQQGDFSKAMLTIATGKSMNPCDGITNIYDVQMQAIKSSEHTTNKYIDMAKWGVGLGLGYMAIDSLITGLSSGTSYVLSGGSKLNQNSQNTGSFNSDVGGDVNTSGGTTVNDNSQNCDGCEDSDFGHNDPEEEDLPTLEDCLADPPGGYNDSGKPMYNDELSCDSYYGIDSG